MVRKCFELLNLGEYEKALKVALEAVKRHPDSFDAVLCLGRAYLEMGELKQALKHLRKAEKLAIELDEHRDVSYLLGRAYLLTGKVEKALDYYTKQLSLSQLMGDMEGTAEALVALAEVYAGIEEQEKALELLHMALSITPKKKAGNIYNNIAIIYSDMKDFEKALEYFQKALEISQKAKDHYGISMILLNIGDTYRELKKYDLAEKNLLSGLDVAKNAKNKPLEALAYECLGDLYFDMGNKKQSKDHLVKAYKLYKEIGLDENAQALEEKIFNLGVSIDVD